MISVYFANTELLKNEDFYLRALELVSSQRREKTLRFRIKEDRIRSLCAELLLKKSLRDLQLDDRNLTYVYGEHEKPSLAGLDSFYFNLSHSEDYVMCAVSDREIGCDIEKTGKADMKIARRYFTAEEYSALENLSSDEEKNDLFFRYWTLKESYIKCTGQGLFLPLNEFEICFDSDDQAFLSSGPDLPVFRFFEFLSVPGYHACICREGDLEKPYTEFVDLSSILL